MTTLGLRGSAPAAKRVELSTRRYELIERSNAFLATLGPEPAGLENELRRIAAALASGRNLELLIRLWGWNGSDPLTLEFVAFELTPQLTLRTVPLMEATAMPRL